MSPDEETSPPGGPADLGPTTPLKRRRRWYQFGLGSLLAFVTLAAVGAGAWRIFVEPYRRQRAVMAVIEKLGGRYQTVEADAWLRRLLDSDLQNVTLVDLADCDEPAEYLDYIVDLPRLSTLVVGGPAFADEHLDRLGRLGSLRLLVLDGARVTDAGLDNLRSRLPEVEIYLSQRRAIAALRKGGNGVSALFTLSHTPLRQLLGNAYFEDAIEVEAGVRSNFGDAQLSHAKECMTLRALVLRDSGVGDEGLAHLKTLTNLERINLVGTRVGDAGLAHLKELPKLKNLDLACTRVSDAGLAQLKGFPSLQCLDLTGTRVSDGGLIHLKELRDLRLLILYGTQATEGGIAELRRALPNCSIYP
jgi:hypothetical protein